ncbi:MAG: aminotransferase class V-fold PLP-dependent enzyme [Chloroflexi bacterium]|nr:aminotransferase class V-fold PLP-dependent enzyme [Chloroflexota bacterium]
MKDLFLLDPTITFLNHGSFGATPKIVFDEYQRWQRELERQPVEFLGRRAASLLAEARSKLAACVGADADEIIFFPNPTHAINMVAKSVSLKTGDEILTTDHEYGAMDRTWHLLCKKVGAKYVHHPIPLPVTTQENFVEHFWSGVNERTKIIFISHITSPTALIFPVKEICRRAREAGILSIVDGAHVPGHVPLNLHDLGCDIYTGACHKWLMAPKGSAFLYARREAQSWLEPLVVSWGWGDDVIAPSPDMGETQFVSSHQWQGTRDLAAFLATPAAIKFQHDHNWDDVRKRCHALAVETRRRVNQVTGLESISPESSEWFNQMVAIRIPLLNPKGLGDPSGLRKDPSGLGLLKTRLYDEFKIEVPVVMWNNQHFIRVSYQGYNTEEEMERLVEALKEIISSRL